MLLPTMRFAPVLALALVPLLAMSASGCARTKAKKDYNRQLPPGALALKEIDPALLPTIHLADREALRTGIKYSLEFEKKKTAADWYRAPKNNGQFQAEQITASLQELDSVVASAGSDSDLNQQIRSRFRVFQSVGCDDKGCVLFTGYYTPIFKASRTPDSTYKHPIYSLPGDVISHGAYQMADQKLPDGSTQPYPDAATLLASGSLKGKELVYVADAYDAYLIRVQGSARLSLPDGKTMEIGYAGTNGHPYTGIGQALVADKKISADQLSFFTIREFFRKNPDQVEVYTSKNPRFIFFTETSGGPFGSLGQPVTPEVSIATDKTIFPPAGPVVVATNLSDGGNTDQKLKDAANKPVNYVALRLDQDSGGGIRAPGRCDLFMGIGEANERRAGGQYAEGTLYYLIKR